MPRGRTPTSDAGKLLQEYGVPQYAIAAKLGVQQPVVSNYLKGVRKPPAQMKAVLVDLTSPHKARKILDAIQS